MEASPFSLCMWIFYIFASLLIAQGLISLMGGKRYLDYVRRETSRSLPDFTPLASVIAPCRGLDQGLRDNLAALFLQDYPSYEIVFVTDRRDDPALIVIEDVRKEFEARQGITSRAVIAGEAAESGQKVHNLRAAVNECDGASEVFVFVDTDARPDADWLRSLIGPLSDEQVGAATGYRWFIPVRGGLSSHLRAVWNASIASALGANVASNFCWGGATAIRRATFERLDMQERWRGTLSDDFALTRALHDAKLPIHFVPNCLTASHEDCTFSELLEFTTRQLKITRVYAPHLWKIVLYTNLFFVVIFYGGLALSFARVALGLSFIAPLLIIALVYALGTGKANLRWRAVKLALARHRAQLREGFFAHHFLWPLASALYLYNALAAAFSRRINWRGITYELKSPTETVIIAPVRTEENSIANEATRRA